jgi:hypothetical protein
MLGIHRLAASRVQRSSSTVMLIRKGVKLLEEQEGHGDIVQRLWYGPPLERLLNNEEAAMRQWGNLRNILEKVLSTEL